MCFSCGVKYFFCLNWDVGSILVANTRTTVVGQAITLCSLNVAYPLAARSAGLLDM